MTCGCRPLIYCFHLSHPQVSLQKAALMTALHPDPPAAGGRAQGWSRAPRHVSEQHQHLLRSGGSEPQQITVRNSPPKKSRKTEVTLALQALGEIRAQKGFGKQQTHFMLPDLEASIWRYLQTRIAGNTRGGSREEPSASVLE